MIDEAMEVIKKTVVKTPIKVGDVVIENILDLDVDIISSKSMNKE